MDLSSVTTAITALNGDITAIGGALLVIAGLALVFSWGKGFIFGNS